VQSEPGVTPGSLRITVKRVDMLLSLLRPLT
jgi:hypothetical protein